LASDKGSKDGRSNSKDKPMAILSDPKNYQAIRKK